MQQLSEAVLAGAGNAVQLIFGDDGDDVRLDRADENCRRRRAHRDPFAPSGAGFAPFISRLSAGKPCGKGHRMNITANLLGLGNAATPMGLAAMKEMAAQNRGSPCGG